MRKFRSFHRRIGRRLLAFVAALCMASWLLLMQANRALAQAVPAGSGGTNPADQPLAGQSLGSSLTLNQGVNAIGAENESFDRFGLGLTASGGEVTNLLGTQTNQQNAAYAQFLASAGLKLQSSRTHYYALYQPQYTTYPQFSAVNNFGQAFYQTLNHAMSERTVVEWDTTAARYLSLNEYVPQSLAIGGIGVAVPSLGTQLLENSFEMTNAATTVSLRHLISARMTFTGTLTGAYILMVPAANVAGANPDIAERFITSGADLRLDYQWTPRDSVGVEATPVYMYGLRPGGHEALETVQGVYQRQLSSTLTARVGVGPLFAQSSSALFGSANDTSYAITASISRQVRQSQFSATYSRALMVDIFEPPIVADTAVGSAYLPMGSHWIFSGAGSYVYMGASATYGYGAGDFYGGSGQIAYQLTSKMQLFALFSLLSETFSIGPGQPSVGFTQNRFGGGIQFNLGNAITRGGAQ